jgi:putative selenate reductase
MEMTMSDKMNPLRFERLSRWIFEEYQRHGSIFGIPKDKFYRHENSHAGFRVFNELIETPIGPAAGPHTQLSQNIICSYLTGSRYIELKTVQALDSIEVIKPCIDAYDEGYNTEWSQELTLEQSLEEYIKSWVLVNVLRDNLGLSQSKDNTGVIFNMSLGYDLKGIRSEKMDRFISGMLNPKEQIDHYVNILQTLYPRLSPVYLPKQITNSVTISTMHGCPPEELEDIGRYLIREKGLNIYVKLNPTLLGKDEVNRILKHTGFDYVSVEDETFEKDLHFEDAVNLIKSLQNYAKEYKRDFGIKLSNTLANKNISKILPGKERYLSGRALFPITVSLAYKLASEFGGKIKISYSGGASAYNLKDIIKTGIYPVTMVTDILKPGGYLRLFQMAMEMKGCSEEGQIQVERLKALAERSLTDAYYQKQTGKSYSIKVDASLPFLDCITTPCVLKCPIHQDIPEFIKYINMKDYTNALNSILQKNPLPNITGYICNQTCIQQCARWDYDHPVDIRELKKIAAQRGDYKEVISNLKLEIGSKKKDKKIAIIGSGPAGLASAHFLAREGFEVTIYEDRDEPGGAVQYLIPGFRLPNNAIKRDISLIQDMGVKIITGHKDPCSIEMLKDEGYAYVIIAIGCRKAKSLDLVSSKINRGYYTGIDFLERVKRGEDLLAGSKVLVIGGGNTAMDVARTASRFFPESIHIIYRRDLDNMPASREEIKARIEEGIEIKELLEPRALIARDAQVVGLECVKMKLGDIDESGRRSTNPIPDSQVKLEADTVIVAIGEEVEASFLIQNGIKLRSNNKIFINETNGETNIPDVFAVGDCVSGPATVIEAISGAKKITSSIMEKERVKKEGSITDSIYKPVPDLEKNICLSKHGEVNFTIPINKLSIDEWENYSSVFAEKKTQEKSKMCLGCNQVCNKCVEICPNRANLALDFPPASINIPIIIGSTNNTLEMPRLNYALKKIDFNQTTQILHLDDLCNECGNCDTFCPHIGKPYNDKLTLFSGKRFFERSKNSGFFLQSSLNEKVLQYRCRIHESVFDMIIDYQNTELCFQSDQFKICLNMSKDGTGLLLKTHTDWGSYAKYTPEMIGLFYIANRVFESHPYLLERE